MSLFKFRTWWHAIASEGNKQVKDEYDRKSMVVGNLLNSKGGENQIVTASLTSGYVRVFSPQSSENQPSDVLLEREFKEPILQLEIGKFIPNNHRDIALAILFARKLCVYRLVTQQSVKNLFEDISEKSTSSSPREGENPISLVLYHLQEVYVNSIPRLGFNFCIGNFGGEIGKDMFCIQSFDGQLSFFDQDRYSFARFLPSFVVPGAIQYFKQIDSLITYNSALKIQCFRYDSLLASIGSQEKDEEKSRGRKVQMEWEVTVGEEVYDIRIVRYLQQSSAGQYEIFVLGERTLFTINQNGTLTSQKRLDYFPSCVCPFIPVKKSIGRTDRKRKHRLIVGTHSNSLMLFAHPKLIWSARTQAVPISMSVGRFGGQDGMIVMLTDEGDLTIGYLGTDPGGASINLIEKEKSGKDLNFRSMDLQVQRLRSKIRKSIKKGVLEEDPSQRIRKIDVQHQISYDFDDGEGFMAIPEENEEEKEGDSIGGQDIANKVNTPKAYPRPRGRAVLKLSVRNCGHLPIDEISLQVTVPNGYVVRPSNIITIKDLKKTSTPFHSTLSIVVKPSSAEHDDEDIDNEDAILPVLRTCAISTIFHQLNGEPNIIQKMFVLPFAMCGKLLFPPRRMIGGAIHALPINLCPSQSGHPRSLRDDLFQDLFVGTRRERRREEEDDDESEIFTFQFYGSCCKEAIVTIIQENGNYRVLTDHFPSLFPIVAELIRRLVTKKISIAGGNISSSSTKKKKIEEEEEETEGEDDEEEEEEEIRKKDDNKNEEKKIEVTIPSIPLYEYFEQIDTHFDLRTRIRKKTKELEEIATQFRNIQKRLIVRYQDRNPKPLGGMEKLLEMTHQEMFNTSIEIQNLQQELRKSNLFVTSGTKLVLLCIQFLFKHLNEKDLYILRNCWGSNLETDGSPNSIEDQGWEERTYGSLSYLYYTIFEKKGKELRKKLLENPKVKTMKDTKSLKGIITKMVEKLKKENIFVEKIASKKKK